MRINPKPKPRWNPHLWEDAKRFTRPTEVLPPYLEGVPAPALSHSPNAHFTLVSAYMNPWFTTTDENP